MRFRKNLHFVLTFVPGPAVKTNRGYGPQPLWQRLLAGWGGSAHSQECLVPKTGYYDFPAHLLVHRFFPSFLNAGARACAPTHTLTHWDSRVLKALFDGPAKPPFPLGGPDAQVAQEEEGGAKGKIMPPTLKIFYPLIFPITHWEVCSGRPESLPNSEVPTTAPAKPATAP